MSTVTLRPRQDYLCEWGGGPAWADLDDVTPDEAATCIQISSGAGTQKNALCYLTLPTVYGKITNVAVYARMSSLSGGSSTGGTLIRTHSTNYAGSSNVLSTTWTTYSTSYAVNPNTSLAWTWQEIVDLKAGCWGILSGSDYPQATQVYIVVTYDELDYYSVTLRPSAAGDLTELTPVGEGSNYLCVDEISPNNDTDYVKGGSTGTTLTDLYSLPNTGIPGEILFVAIFNVAEKYYAGTAKIRPCMKHSGTVYYGMQADLIQGSYLTYYEAWGYNPATGAKWVQSDIDALQAGVELENTSADQPRCTQVYVLVGYRLLSVAGGSQIIGLLW